MIEGLLDIKSGDDVIIHWYGGNIPSYGTIFVSEHTKSYDYYVPRVKFKSFSNDEILLIRPSFIKSVCKLSSEDKAQYLLES